MAGLGAGVTVLKACAVVVRDGAAGRELLVFRHPLAGVQLVKGSVERSEPPGDAARRELAEEAGLTGLAHAGALGVSDAIASGQVWHFFRFDCTGLPEDWTHRCADDGGHDFAFFWHALADAPGADWHPIFVAALAHVRAQLAREPVVIRAAEARDAEAAMAVIRRSISTLCAADHGDDPAQLAGWLANKTAAHFRAWLVDPRNAIIVATRGGKIVGVGGLREGEGITLNYVDPDARFTGVSDAMIGALEARLRAKGEDRALLTSTETAFAFYAARGYVRRELAGEAMPPFGIAMEKRL